MCACVCEGVCVCVGLRFHGVNDTTIFSFSITVALLLYTYHSPCCYGNPTSQLVHCQAFSVIG